MALTPPIGTILPIVQGNRPEGFLGFDGQTVSKADYPKLWECWWDVREHLYLIGVEIDEDEIAFPDLDDAGAQTLAWGARVSGLQIDLVVRAR